MERELMTRSCVGRSLTRIAQVAPYYLLLITVFSCSANAQSTTEAQVRALRYPGGYDVRAHERKDTATFTVSFRTHLSYPSLAVLEFYDRELRGLGWIQFAEAQHQQSYRKWDCFEDLTQPGKPFVHQLQAKWVNQDRSRMVFLAVLYRSVKVERKGVPCPLPDSETQQAHVQLMPFVPLPR